MGGRLIALEGIDGSGLSTQTAAVAAALRARGEQCFATKEPTQGPAGAVLRLALGGRLGQYPHAPDAGRQSYVPLDPRVAALLFAADRLDHLGNDIAPRLAAGVTVICDRYILSSLAYQALEVDLAWLRAINNQAAPADLTIFLDVAPETAIARVRSRGARLEIYERLETLRQIRANYLERLDELRRAGGAVAIVPGSGTVEEVTAALLVAADARV